MLFSLQLNDLGFDASKWCIQILNSLMHQIQKYLDAPGTLLFFGPNSFRDWLLCLGLCLTIKLGDIEIASLKDHLY